MLYVLGGASRAGKTSLSRRAVSEFEIPYFPLDSLLYGLVKGFTQLDISWDQPFVERAEKAWPIAKHMFNFFLEEEKDFLIEGDSILPSQVYELSVQGKKVRSCFLGYTELSKDEKLALIRKYHQGDIDWTKSVSDEEMLTMVDQMIEFSKYLKNECAEFGIKYLDVSHDFDAVRAEAFDYLFKD